MVDPRRAVLALTVALAGSARAEKPVVRDFFNVIQAEGADPWVWKHSDGRYYLTVTTGGNVSVIRADTITGLNGGERKVVWTPPRSGPLSRDVWAPELHRIAGAWYVYVAADDGKNANHRMYVLENRADDPFQGKFLLKGKLADPRADRWAIDGTVFEAMGRLYFLWSGWEGDVNGRQDLYIAPMRDPWTLSGPRVAISRPTFPWEVRGGPPTINEGPQALIRGGSIHIIYSASGSWTNDYCLGLLSADLDGDLLAPGSWKKHDRPVFESRNRVFGPGHCSFTKSPDGSEDWIVYHSARSKGSGWDRTVRAQRFAWNVDGSPLFGAPVKPEAPIPLPSGEPTRWRFKGDGGDVNISTTEAGPRRLWVHYSTGSKGRGREGSQPLVVNEGPPRSIRFPDSGPDHGSVVGLSVTLRQGANRLRFDKGEGAVAIDSIDLVNEPRGDDTPSR